MKIRNILVVLALALSGAAAKAQSVEGAAVDSVRFSRSGDYMIVDMEVDMSALEVESNRAVLLTPVFFNGADSVSLSSIGVYGRRRYFHYVRNGESMLTKDERSYRASERPDTVAYHSLLPYRDWMDGAQLVMHREDYGCCNTLLGEQTGKLGVYEVPVILVPELPALAYVRPTAENEKRYALSGSAFVDFPVNRTEIYPNYRRNTIELVKIYATIDSVRNDSDVHITSVWLKGYASPESPYAHNAELAKGRVAALKNHIQRFYRFEPGVIDTDFEPEDWAGLRRYVDASDLAHRTGILDLIDSDLDPDVKEWRIKRNYPGEYKLLLQECYPALRHTDYRIEYTIRRFTDVEEIKRVMKTNPQKLSLNEFYLAAQSCEVGSDEFNDIFEMAVHIYPDDSIANLNAANTALQRSDWRAAKRYLDRSGDSAEAVYARGIYELMNENYDAAGELMQQAQEAGISQADEALVQIEKLKKQAEKLKQKTIQ